MIDRAKQLREIREELDFRIKERKWKEAEAETWRLAKLVREELALICGKYGFKVHKIYIRSQSSGSLKEQEK